ncbi:MAG: hypothetical protein KC912_25745 [Proteobacteria bacterium]|nr:hypothetical protein [Pseudomonadota bacterium]
MPKNYIGLSCTAHDSALAIVNAEGEVVFAQATERYIQTKRAFHAVPDQLGQIGPLLESYCEPGAELVMANSWAPPSYAAIGWWLMDLRMRWKSHAWVHRAHEWAFFRTLIQGTLNQLSLAGLNLQHAVLTRGISDQPVLRRSYDHHLTTRC